MRMQSAFETWASAAAAAEGAPVSPPSYEDCNDCKVDDDNDELIELILLGLLQHERIEDSINSIPVLQRAESRRCPCYSADAVAKRLFPPVYRIDRNRSVGASEAHMFGTGSPAAASLLPHLHDRAAGVLFATRRRCAKVRFVQLGDGAGVAAAAAIAVAADDAADAADAAAAAVAALQPSVAIRRPRASRLLLSRG